jgi:tRNA(fMet)-specific endonuclease VapC
MSGRSLIDTNIAIALFADEVTVKDHLAKADEVFVSSIAVGELCYGAWKSKRAKENLARIDDFVDNIVVIDCDTDTARCYGEIKNALRLKGHPLPESG